MPETFDEEWEYYIPDSEIEEILKDDARKDPNKHLPKWDYEVNLSYRTIQISPKHRKRLSIKLRRCKRCNKEYVYVYSDSKFCTRRCSTLYRCRNSVWIKKRKLRKLWNKGVTIFDICCILHSHQHSIMKWRKQLGLPSRRKKKGIAPCH